MLPLPLDFVNMKKVIVEVSDELRTAWPQFRGVAVFAEVTNSAYNESLWKRIEEFTEIYRQKYTVDSIKEMPAIQATRQVYKKCGKDPSRYRPSSEALCRRILRGIPLYQIDTLVDLINLASIYSGHSIGGFDLDKIQGDRLVLGIGKAGEPYEGIGRGEPSGGKEEKVKTKAKKKTYITGLHGSGSAKMKAEYRRRRATRHKNG